MLAKGPRTGGLLEAMLWGVRPCLPRLSRISLVPAGVRLVGEEEGGQLTAEERSVREPNIALKRLPADREERRLSFFGGIFGGQTFRAPSLLRSAEKEKH